MLLNGFTYKLIERNAPPICLLSSFFVQCGAYPDIKYAFIRLLWLFVQFLAKRQIIIDRFMKSIYKFSYTFSFYNDSIIDTHYYTKQKV